MRCSFDNTIFLRKEAQALVTNFQFALGINLITCKIFLHLVLYAAIFDRLTSGIWGWESSSRLGGFTSKKYSIQAQAIWVPSSVTHCKHSNTFTAPCFSKANFPSDVSPMKHTVSIAITRSEISSLSSKAKTKLMKIWNLPHISFGCWRAMFPKNFTRPAERNVYSYQNLQNIFMMV